MQNLESMEVSHSIYKLAKECPVSGNDSNKLLEFHGLVLDKNRGFWSSYKDRRVLDVCAGLSDVTAKLLQLGADAYALDYGYSDIGELYIRAGNRINGLFDKSYSQNRDHYITGSAHKMPFESNSFDAVTSYYGIFGVIDADPELGYQAINESIRVVKPGGIISIGPYNSGDITKKQAASEEIILSRLKTRDDIEYFVKQPYRNSMWIGFQDISRVGKLTITKFLRD